MRRLLPLSLLALLPLAACEYPAASLHPLYTDADLVDLPELEGRWTDDDAALAFTRLDSGVYALDIIPEEGGGTLRAVARTLELDGTRFLDLSPDMTFNAGSPNAVPFPVLPAHLWFAMELQGDALTLEAIPLDAWVEALQARGAEFHLFGDDGGTEYLVLTQETAVLQGLVAEVFGDPGVERAGTIFVRARS